MFIYLAQIVALGKYLQATDYFTSNAVVIRMDQWNMASAYAVWVWTFLLIVQQPMFASHMDNTRRDTHAITHEAKRQTLQYETLMEDVVAYFNNLN